MKHKHYEMIVAKAANMDLVVFSKRNDSNRWVELEIHKQCISFNEAHSYFLCLPQHKDACLHWLNGGELEILFFDNWEGISDFSCDYNWKSTCKFMRNEHPLRIKPKKEKRWIAYCASRNQVIPHAQDTKQLASDYTALHYSHHVDEWQFIEIEVEEVV
ncbi:conserved hypothetical protein [Vibrio phage 193E37-1]|nr:conserved hypothetical protein [Vibrio phage 193E37-1]